MGKSRSRSDSRSRSSHSRSRSKSISKSRSKSRSRSAEKTREKSHDNRIDKRAWNWERSHSRSMSRSRSRSRSRRHSSSSDRSSRSRRSDDYVENGVRLHVADLGMGVSKHDLEHIFEKFGHLREIWVAKSPPCFAFVVYKDKRDAEKALNSTDGITVCGSRIRVSIARPRTRGRNRHTYNPNMRCYQCGDRGHFSRDCPDSKYGYKRPPSSRDVGRSPSRYRSSYSSSYSSSSGRRRSRR